MQDEFGEYKETEPVRKSKKPQMKMTFEKAIEMGEYDPNFLATFPQWAGYTNYIRWNYIRQAIQNRRRFLLLNWAETNDILDIRLKPEIQQVMDNIMRQVEELNKEEERLRVEYIK